MMHGQARDKQRSAQSWRQQVVCAICKEDDVIWLGDEVCSLQWYR